MADVGLPFPNEYLHVTSFMGCLKVADQVEMQEGFTHSTGVRGTRVLFLSDTKGLVCELGMVGNPYHLAPNGTKTFEVVDAAAAMARAARGPMIDEIWGGTVADGFTWRVTGLKPVSAAAFLAIITNGDADAAYRDFIGLFDSNDLFRGGNLADRMDPGAGNDRVVGRGGDDIAFKWKAGNINFDGGAGHDILSFAADQASVPFPSTAVETLRIDLAAGTGRSPWGGKVVLTSVEEIQDTDGRDVIFGSARGDTVQSDYGGGDTFKLRGGDDTVQIFVQAENLTYDGGAGRDTLSISLGSGDNTLDLGDPAANAGVFAGARLSGVEVISASSIWTGSTFRLVGTAAAEAATFAAGTFAGTPFARAVLALGGGNDLALGGAGDDVIAGGTGRDVLDGAAGDDRLTGGAQGDRFHFIDGFGHDRITDFQDGADRLDFSDHFGVDRLRDLTIRQVGDGVTVADGDGGVVTLAGVDRQDIGAADFLFA